MLKKFFWKTRSPLRPVSRSLILLGLSSLAVGSLVPFSVAQSPQPVAPDPIQLQPVAEVGWEFEGVRTLNRVMMYDDEFYGECPGKTWYAINARFLSSKTPPGPNRRVTVRAVTRGISSNPFPYTDREYDKGRSSEATRVAFGTQHDNGYFRVLPGENEFEYEIKESGRVIDSGRFTAQIAQNRRSLQRDATLYRDRVCANTGVSLEACADIRNRTQYRCPDGKVVRGFLEPNDSAIATTFSNQTYSNVVFRINGYIGSLRPGEQTTFRQRGTSNLRVDFDPDCATCRPTRSFNKQPGKRYQFRESGKKIELADFPSRRY